MDAVVVREGKNLKGRLLAIALGTGGKRVLAKSQGKTVKAIEARNFQAKAADLEQPPAASSAALATTPQIPRRAVWKAQAAAPCDGTGARSQLAWVRNASTSAANAA